MSLGTPENSAIQKLPIIIIIVIINNNNDDENNNNNATGGDDWSGGQHVPWERD